MKKLIIKIALIVGLIVVIAAAFFIKYIYDEIQLGKSIYIVIQEDELVDYNAVNQEQYRNRFPRLWFTMLRETEREKLVSYMKENNYRIAPGAYHIYQGSKFKDLLKELKFEEIT